MKEKANTVTCVILFPFGPLSGELQNGSAHAVGASYSGLYEEGEVEHINCGIGPKI